jgi:hypothetical protein
MAANFLEIFLKQIRRLGFSILCKNLSISQKNTKQIQLLAAPLKPRICFKKVSKNSASIFREIREPGRGQSGGIQNLRNEWESSAMERWWQKACRQEHVRPTWCGGNCGKHKKRIHEFGHLEKSSEVGVAVLN